MPLTPQSNSSFAMSETPTATADTNPSTRNPEKNGLSNLEQVETIKPRVRTGVEIDDYFVGSLPVFSSIIHVKLLTFMPQSGPLDPSRHSKLPCFMRLHGSILPKMIMPVLVVGIWATSVTLISKHIKDCTTFPFQFGKDLTANWLQL